MGLAIYLSVLRPAEPTEGVTFDDLTALNADLIEKTGVSELVDFYTPPPVEFTGFIKQDAKGAVLLSELEEHKFNGYKSRIEVWGCWEDKAAKIIAKHITAGKLVLHLDIEGNPDEYYVLTPGKVVKPSPADF
jgi:hypothetical protein